ncbi:MAG: radical SAM protein [Gammaproteobacteria bacterium]|nr:radical SAM protein [Gammaproteobacteria bacterium]
MIEYDTPLYRPPSEGDNLIIQVTLGCSFNQCSFCSMYKQKQYVARNINDVILEINKASKAYPSTRRVFLADGDALSLPTETLLKLLTELQKALPSLQRVSCYATPANILNKTNDELLLLKENKLSLLYLGIESGSDILLKKITKGASQRSIREAMNKAFNNRIKVSGTIILGLGGKQYWQEHIEQTIQLVNSAPLTYLSTLQLFLHDTAVDEFKEKYSEPFEFQDDRGILAELKLLIAGISPPGPIVFRSNHASNALPLAGNLPKDRTKLLSQIDAAINGERSLRPEDSRSL